MIKSDNSIKKTSFIYFLSLLPLFLFGFYKNGINLYNKGYVNIYGMFKPIIILLMGCTKSLVHPIFSFIILYLNHNGKCSVYVFDVGRGNISAKFSV